MRKHVNYNKQSFPLVVPYNAETRKNKKKKQGKK